jgi:transcriptional regulator with XRE-family HTH domain
MVSHANAMSKFIKERRKDLRLSQGDLSNLIFSNRKSGQFVSNIERGLCQFPAKMIKRLSDVLMVSEESIIDLMVMDYKRNLINEVINAPELPDQTIN